MITIRQEDLIHKMHLQKLLIAIVDNPILSQGLHFKGGTAAAMLGFLDRFSIDLDFDSSEIMSPSNLKRELVKIFNKLNLKIVNNNNNSLFFVLKYEAPIDKRNTVKLSIYEEIIKANEYKKSYLQEIDRLVSCQTIETMFANKLVAPIDRFNKHQKIAGRDIYDIHHFFSQGYKFNENVIEERTKTSVQNYIKILIDFIENNVTEKIIDEDLNTLLPISMFSKIRKVLKQETLNALRLVINI